jgi:hypothetical protein
MGTGTDALSMLAMPQTTSEAVSTEQTEPKADADKSSNLALFQSTAHAAKQSHKRSLFDD